MVAEEPDRLLIMEFILMIQFTFFSFEQNNTKLCRLSGRAELTFRLVFL